MMTGIVAYDERIEPDVPGDYVIYVGDCMEYEDVGASMNAAIHKLMHDGCEQVVFIGHGCTAQQYTITDHVEQLERHLYPLITCGRILHRNDCWKDFRETGNAKRLKLFRPAGCIIQNAAVLTSGYGISISNFGINRAAIDRMARFTQIYYEQPGPFPEMKSMCPYGYGKVLSLCAWCSRVTMFMLPNARNNAVVCEMDGSNPYSEHYHDADVSSDHLSDINEKMTKKPLGLDFFDSPRDYQA